MWVYKEENFPFRMVTSWNKLMWVYKEENFPFQMDHKEWTILQ